MRKERAYSVPTDFSSRNILLQTCLFDVRLSARRTRGLQMIWLATAMIAFGGDGGSDGGD